jgi:hypothetical protein
LGSGHIRPATAVVQVGAAPESCLKALIEASLQVTDDPDPFVLSLSKDGL